ncbi:hypothetical protein [Nocardia sp. SYP-A9097]|uniref:hypothetical protein n=1 Tax=Nocardia sp. SYP-A9097 TaxID=2663237 RepID=UPI001E4548FD|nr:hypothetical protein [Nocardia sp. SYP-A9097]
MRQIADARTRFAPDAEILTANYGEAAAIERFGGAHGLPTPHSPHNAYWWWGPPADGRPVLAVGLNPGRITRLCADAEQVGRIDNGLGIDNDEQGRTLYVCRALRLPWAETWPTLCLLG